MHKATYNTFALVSCNLLLASQTAWICQPDNRSVSGKRPKPLENSQSDATVASVNCDFDRVWRDGLELV